MSSLRQLESMGTWVCQCVFSWFLFRDLAETISVSILWMCNTDEAGISFLPIPIIQTHHPFGSFMSNPYRQMAEGFLQIQATSLAEAFKTPSDSLAGMEG
jgi:hypothetical protein